MKQQILAYKNIFIVICLSCISPSIGLAESALSNVNLYLQLSSYRYEEPNVMKKEGNRPVLGIGADYNSNHSYPFSANISADFGKTNYRGTGETRNDPFYVLRGEISKKLYKTPFDIHVGFGTRYLYDDWGIGKTSTNHHTYDRSSTYNYAFTSFTHNFQNKRTMKIKVKKLIRGKQKIFISHVPGYQNTKMDQRHGFGIETEWTLTDELKVFTEYWNVGRSRTDTNGYGITEPQNTTFQIGFRYAL